jgi:hypothetical protein
VSSCSNAVENLFVVDNVEIPNTNTFGNFPSAGGTVSILDAELIEDVIVLTGGYPAAYANRTSSVLQIAQREGSGQRFRGWGLPPRTIRSLRKSFAPMTTPGNIWT